MEVGILLHRICVSRKGCAVTVGGAEVPYTCKMAVIDVRTRGLIKNKSTEAGPPYKEVKGESSISCDA
jgi:hypothetical protein